jgi:hypothetical protein
VQAALTTGALRVTSRLKVPASPWEPSTHT